MEEPRCRAPDLTRKENRGHFGYVGHVEVADDLPLVDNGLGDEAVHIGTVQPDQPSNSKVPEFPVRRHPSDCAG